MKPDTAKIKQYLYWWLLTIALAILMDKCRRI